MAVGVVTVRAAPVGTVTNRVVVVRASITLRPVTDDDEAFLLELYASTRDDVAGSPLTEADKAQFIAMQCRAQRTDYETRFPEAEHSIVVVDGVSAGRIWIDRRDDEIRLLDVSLLPGDRNSGVGGVLLDRLIAEATAAGTPLRHSVLTENEAALRFYRRRGFEVIEDFGMYVLMEFRPNLTHD